MSESHLEAQRLLEIKEVVLRNSVVTVREGIDASIGELDESTPQHLKEAGDIDEMEVKGEESGSNFWMYKFSYTVGVRLVGADELEGCESESYVPQVLILATFESRYYSSKQISPDAIKDFSRNNVGFNIWPYWRELVQSSCARLGLPHCIQVPLYRMVKADVESAALPSDL